MLVFSHEFVDIRFCESLDILDDILDYGAQSFSLHGPIPPPPSCSITFSSPYSSSKDGYLLHLLGHLLLTLRDDISSHGSMFKDETS